MTKARKRITDLGAVNPWKRTIQKIVGISWEMRHPPPAWSQDTAEMCRENPKHDPPKMAR